MIETIAVLLAKLFNNHDRSKVRVHIFHSIMLKVKVLFAIGMKPIKKTSHRRGLSGIDVVGLLYMFYKLNILLFRYGIRHKDQLLQTPAETQTLRQAGFKPVHFICTFPFQLFTITNLSHTCPGLV